MIALLKNKKKKEKNSIPSYFKVDYRGYIQKGREDYIYETKKRKKRKKKKLILIINL